MSLTIELELNNQKELYTFNKVAKQANGSVLAQIGKCVVLATVATEFDNPVSEDFTPLTVQYVEKTYAAAKMPGGFVKRESKPSDFETLTSRIIDRSLRPLFPKGFIYPTTITVMVLSADKDVDLQTMALNAASAALFVSDLPICKPVCGVRIAKIDGELKINPTPSQLKNSVLDLYVAGTKEEMLMIEMKSIASQEMIEVDLESFAKIHQMNEMDEDELIDAISIASSAIEIATMSYENSFAKAQKETNNAELKTSDVSTEIIDFVKEKFYKETKAAVAKLAKSERAVELKEVAKSIMANDFVIENNWNFDEISQAVAIVKKEIVRDMIINDRVRADGRALNEIRPISIETNILPSAHSSCLFTRGQTQALVVGTLGNQKDGQMFELLNEKSTQNDWIIYKDVAYYKLETVYYCFLAFSLPELLASLPLELKHYCLTLLN